MKKIFEDAEIEIISLGSEDVICTSGESPFDEVGTSLPGLEDGIDIIL